MERPSRGGEKRTAAWASYHEERGSDGAIAPPMCDHRVVLHRCVVREWCTPSGSAVAPCLHAAARTRRAARAVKGDVLSVWQVLHETPSAPPIPAQRVARFDDHCTRNCLLKNKLRQRYSRYNEVVKSDIHSTDTGGYSEILFGAMHLLGFAFAPRIKNFAQCQLYAFQKRKGYEQQGDKMLPDAYIKPELLADQWDEILRFIATIKLKEATASQLFKRLNSYSRQHPLYHALQEFGKIPKSDFLLRYIDIVVLRQAVEQQLNKGENANKFSRAVSFGNHQEFLYGEKIEQEIAEGCRRLIKNAIICWNYLYLTKKLTEADSEERRQELLTAVRHGSVVTWQHINLHVEYDFSDEKLQDSIGLLLPVIWAVKGF